ncbi:uncharacterized protein CC84DRAFT_410980 [Paraphaeosphaeria sporulosa]|uniref:Uncharacterized protein n=1 Tax=Paraphaeosphaeria sporulosa TaxID=1460663 RepID=A0A177BUJ2_9PLEO|nr:uncharacterized protein CC84DRAFT_410980 [Paraphaeosphaeria sporulosa]OAF98954.1 hypothetical protein CC84DRAFT_410980 [Paraphaeosphaeria sporulosa]
MRAGAGLEGCNEWLSSGVVCPSHGQKGRRHRKTRRRKQKSAGGRAGIGRRVWGAQRAQSRSFELLGHSRGPARKHIPGQNRCNLEEEGSGGHVAAAPSNGWALAGVPCMQRPYLGGRTRDEWPTAGGRGLEGAEGLDVCTTRRDGQQSGGHWSFGGALSKTWAESDPQGHGGGQLMQLTRPGRCACTWEIVQ